MTAQPQPSDIRRDLVTLLPRLRRFALTLVDQGHDVDELVREACARAAVKGQQPAHEERLESWIFGLIRCVWQENAKSRKQPSRDSIHTSFADNHIFMDMPQGTAAAFLLVAVEEHSYAQAAAILDSTPERIAADMLVARRQFADMTDSASERRA